MSPPSPTPLTYSLLLLISCSYMSLWVSLGTLIDYYNALHGPLFFLYLNTAFYAPGLPISYFQMVFDQKYDARYGAGRTWAFRIAFSMFCLLICSLLLPITTSPTPTVLLTLLIGVSTWTSHGTLTTITSLYPTRAVGYLQFGFQVPNLYVLGLVAGLGIYGLPKSQIVEYVEGNGNGMFQGFSRLERFYYSTSVVIFLGIVGAFVLNRLKSLKGIRREYERGITGELGSLGRRGSDEEEEEEDLETPLLVQNKSELSLTSLASSNSSTSSEFECTVLTSVSLHRKVLFFTIFSSIFSGSLFANVPREEGGEGVDLGQILYFTRLFADLFGRVLTWLPRRYLVSSITGLYYIMLLRLLLLLIFIAYIFSPPSLRWDSGVIALVFVCAMQSGYNAVLVYELVGKKVNQEYGKGRTTGGTTEVKDRRGEEGCKAKAVATRGLNMSFQYACAGACVCNVIGAAVLGN